MCFIFLYITLGVMAEINSKHLCLVVDFETAALTKQVSSSYRRVNGGQGKISMFIGHIKVFLYT